MPKTGEQHLDLVLIADDAYRIAMLRSAIRQARIQCTIRRLAGTSKTLAYLAREKGYRKSPQPTLVLFDFADVNARVVEVARRLAFGPQRSLVPVIFLTSANAESVLSSGELDDSETTMFSPRPLASILQKLSDRRRQEFLNALSTLYQYGPILVRQPRQFLEPKKNLTQLSA